MAAIVDVRGLGAYLDESEEHDTMCVGGVLFWPSQRRRFVPQWTARFPDGFHATEVNGHRGNLGDAEPGAMNSDAARVLGGTAEFIAGSTIRISEVARIFGRERDMATRMAYAICGMNTAFAMAAYITECERKEKITYILDSGRKGRGEILEVFSRLRTKRKLKDLYKIETLGFEDLDDPHLQAADFLAWEYREDRTSRPEHVAWADFEQRRPHFKTLISELRQRQMVSRKVYYGDLSLGFVDEHVDWIEWLLDYVPRVRVR